MAIKRTEAESGCWAKVGDDEPVFVLRAADRIAPTVVVAWAKMAEAVGVSDGKIDEAYALAAQMLVWQDKNGCKVPD